MYRKIKQEKNGHHLGNCKSALFELKQEYFHAIYVYLKKPWLYFTKMFYKDTNTFVLWFIRKGLCFQKRECVTMQYIPYHKSFLSNLISFSHQKVVRRKITYFFLKNF